MLYLVLSYFPWMVMLPSTRYNLSFASKGKFMCGIIMCANWLIDSLHHIRTEVHVPTSQTIDTALATDPDLDLLG